MDHKKPGSPGDILKHHGVKGQKWGIRKDREGDGNGKDAKELADHNARTKAYMAAGKQIPDDTPEQSMAKFRASQKKFAEKFAPSGGVAPTKGASGKIEGVARDEPRLTPGQKKALIYGGAGVAVIGGTYLASKYLQKNPSVLLKLTGLDSGSLNFSASPESLGLKSFSEIERLAGKPIDSTQYHGLVGFSQGKTWFNGNATSYLTDSAFARQAFELPAGHTFYRISTSVEDKFNPTTYANHSLDDFNRYVAGFRHEKGMFSTFQKVTWQSKEAVKVPDLTTVLGSLHASMVNDPMFKGQVVNDKTVMKHYQDLSGGGWSTPIAKRLIDTLKKQGYGALVDEMDAGVVGETPLVFFGSKVTPKRSVPLDNAAIQRAEQLLKEIPKPPGRKY